MEIRENEIGIKENEKILTISDWIKINLMMGIPILGFIITIKFLVSEKTNINLKNYLIAFYLMFMIIIVFFSVGVTVVLLVLLLITRM
ncbi:MAG: hypothetical protein ACRC0S_10125 [Fusobacteriaceae bacterium]